MVTCSPPDTIANGGRDYTTLTVGSKAEYYCNSGYRLSGGKTLTCQADRSWSPAAPSCTIIIVKCTSLSRPANGDVTYSNPALTPGTVATFVCNSGYVREGSDQVRCLGNGRWSGAGASCRAVTCPSLPNVPNANKAVSGDYSPGTTVTYTCSVGYSLNGARVVTCLSSGRWSSGVPSCAPITCPILSEIANGRSSTVGDGSAGTRITYTCNSGYKLNGFAILTCSREGRWDRSQPVCNRIQCSYLGTPTNGFVKPPNLAKAAYSVGESITYECQSSYSLQGSSRVTCLTSGSWDNSLPTCEVVFCVNPGTPTNGYIASGSLDRYTVNSRVTYSCNRGYRLEGASVLVCQGNGQFSAAIPSCTGGLC